MPAPIDLRTDYTAEMLHEIASSVGDRAHARRLRAVAAILAGRSRSEAAKIGGMERQTLRDWVHRFNTEGPDGLKSHRSPGRPPKLHPSQRDELAALIAAGPQPDATGIKRWRLCDLVQLIRDRWGVEHDEVSVGRIMKRLGYVYTGFEWQTSPSSQPAAADGEPGEPELAASYTSQPVWQG